MKYFIRSVKYFVYLSVILCIIILALVKLKFVSSDIQTMFVNGYDSLWQMALIIAAFAALYPRFGYCRRNVPLPGSDEEIRPLVDKVMEEHGYKFKSSDSESLLFIKRAPLDRAVKRWEDGISFRRELDGYSIEGPTKDVVRLVSAFETVSGQ